MTILIEPKCIRCKYYDPKSGTCAAFPGGIPDDIYFGSFDHVNPYPNAENPTDNGIRFEPIED